jgi:hypothetical protein
MRIRSRTLYDEVRFLQIPDASPLIDVDVYPVTLIGRIIAVCTVIMGVSSFGVLTASTARVLLSSDQTQ